MKTKRYILAAIGLSIILVIAIFGSMQEMTNAQECRIVRVYGQVAQTQGSLRLEPTNVSINRNTCVIWVNLSQVSEIKVNFRDGKTCADASEAPSGFKMAEACYVTSWVPHGATSSLTFKEKGTYNYEVEWKEQKVKENGRIVVQ